MLLAALSAELTVIPNLHCHMLCLSFAQRHSVELNLHGMSWMRASSRPCVLTLGGICEATAAHWGGGLCRRNENSLYVIVERLCVERERERERTSSLINRICGQSRSFAKNNTVCMFMDVQREKEQVLTARKRKKRRRYFISLMTPSNGLLIHCFLCPPCLHKHFYVKSTWQEFVRQLGSQALIRVPVSHQCFIFCYYWDNDLQERCRWSFLRRTVRGIWSPFALHTCN